MSKFCPEDRVTALIIVERNGIEIDYCPACRGVWLERGELEKLLETDARMTKQGQRADAPQMPADPLAPPPSAYPPGPQIPPHGYNQPPAYRSEQPHGYNNSGGYVDGKRRRKKGWLDDIFDFD
jgi:Zn-finger nucleic acid-binding protein